MVAASWAYRYNGLSMRIFANFGCLKCLIIVACVQYTRGQNVDLNISELIDTNEEVLTSLVKHASASYNNSDSFRSCSCSKLGCQAEFTDGLCEGSSANKLISKFGGECSHICTQRKVDMTTATVWRSLKSQSKDVQSRIEACWTESLDEKFNSTLRVNNDTLRWQYIGTPNGLLRLFPGIPQERCSEYDPTLRPWYVAAISGRKNVVMLLDVSDSMNDFGRLELLREAVKGALNALDNIDYVGIIVFGSTAQPLVGNVLRLADQGARAELSKAIDNIKTLGGTNFEDAFQTAFQMLSNSSRVLDIASCNTAILFVTDGIPTVGERNEVKLMTMIKNLDNTTLESPAKIFTYVLGDSTRTVLPKKIACETRGFFTHVRDGERFVDKFTLNYAEFFSLLRETTEVVQSVWVEPYIDAFGLGLVTTVSQPVYDEHSRLIGVIGIDVSVANLRQATGNNDTVWQDAIQSLANQAVCANFINASQCLLNSLRDTLGVELCEVNSGDKICVITKEREVIGPEAYFSGSVSPPEFCSEKRESFDSEVCCVGVPLELAPNTTCTEYPSVESFRPDILKKPNSGCAVMQAVLSFVFLACMCVCLIL